MKVVILCGGLGTRLREETEFRPKPMVEIGGRPVLWHIMRHYARHGFDEFVLCLGYKGASIRDYFLTYAEMHADVKVDLGSRSVEHLGGPDQGEEWKVTLVDTGAETATGGRLLQVERYLDDRFLCTYGDGVSNVDLRRLVSFHEQAGVPVTVTGVRPPSRFGEIVVEGGRATSFREKPPVVDAWVSGGFFVIDRAFLRDVRPEDMFEQEPLRRLAERRQLAVYEHAGYWAAMDTYRDVLALNREWESGRPGWLEPS